MNAQDWVVIISASSAAVTGILAAVFTGLMSLRQLPQHKADIKELHECVGGLRDDIKQADKNVKAHEAAAEQRELDRTE